MKKITINLLAFILTANIVFAQAPESFKYQAAVRDDNGGALINQNVTFQISILETSANGNSVYVETHNVTTSNSGLVNFNIGNGIVSSGVFANINWASDAHFVKVEMDENAGNNYELLGTSQLLSVPYALHAKTVESKQDISLNGDTLSISDGSSVVLALESDTFTGAFATAGNITSNSLGDYDNDDFVFGSPTLDYDGNNNHGRRFFFDKSLAAFRAGRNSGVDWNEDSLGFTSAAFGLFCKATGSGSFSAGSNNTASGQNSFALGSSTEATGGYSFSLGSSNLASGNGAIALGAINTASGFAALAANSQTTASGDYASSFGLGSTASGNTSFAAGEFTIASGLNSFVFGTGNGGGSPLTNNTDNSFLVGFSNVPSFSVTQTTVTVNEVLHLNPQATPPVAGSQGDLYMDTDGFLYLHNGIGWQQIAFN